MLAFDALQPQKESAPVVGVPPRVIPPPLPGLAWPPPPPPAPITPRPFAFLEPPPPPPTAESVPKVEVPPSCA